MSLWPVFFCLNAAWNDNVVNRFSALDKRNSEFKLSMVADCMDETRLFVISLQEALHKQLCLFRIYKYHSY